MSALQLSDQIQVHSVAPQGTAALHQLPNSASEFQSWALETFPGPNKGRGN